MNGRQRTSDKLMVIYYSFSTPELGENKQDDQTEDSQHTEGKTLLCTLCSLITEPNVQDVVEAKTINRIEKAEALMEEKSISVC